ncbi:SusC/RagA family TonB-linked outer membrane protein [Segetibacter sp. 3557_3]|uniref:SusC/RagA family TonB-linked outer membrane protein n=1 Tax=Segetibacter sp. 3557_3 TaxID=2547429 RepID=UPI001058E8B5|nr:SusC/RagA family TonB-linked outer membrane protein [Segetibacter sp. 3557_3]TDH28610.1 SusC/RagA family TonB-linked outer membrane protein [Segetibacter sp. 3557_3]
MRKYLLTLMLMHSVFFVFAQTRRITGIITDAQSNQPLTGVTILANNQRANAVSENDGRFTLTVPQGRVDLDVSYVGYKSQTVRVNADQQTISVALEIGEGQMSDVVVTALGVKRDRRSLGYATSTVSGDQLTKAGTTLNPALSLYGKAAGVGVNIGSSGPTGGVNINIRGAGGLESNSKTRPLFVVDGVPIYDQATSMANTTYDPLNSLDYGSGINDLNSDDIESIEILKGAKATVLYGSQGLNGVVLITTKSGKKTRGLGVTVSHQTSIDRPFSFIDFQNEYGSGTSILDTATTVLPNGQRVRTLRADRLSFGPKFDGNPVMRYDSTMVPYVAHPNNFLDFFQNGVTNRTNVAIAGGGEFGSARASYSNIDFSDLLPNSYQKSNNFSFNGNFSVSPFANFEFISNIYSVKTKNRRPNIEQVVAFGLNRDYDYNFINNFYMDENGYQRVLDNYALPPSANRLIGVLNEQNNNSDIDNKFHTINSIKTTLKFTKNISFIGQAAVDYTTTDFTTQNKIVRLLPTLTGGKFQFRKSTSTVQNYQGILNYEKNLNNDLHIFAFAGAAYQQVRYNELFAGTGDNGLRFPDWYSMNNDIGGAPELSKVRGIVRGADLLYGVFGSFTASWKNTLYLEIQGRNDWNSSLSPGNNSYFYPGASLTYNFSNNITIPKMKYGKFRFSWADIGGGPTTSLQDRYFANNAYTVGTIYENATIRAVTPPGALFLGDIKPFRKREFELGLNTRWFEQNRLEVDFSFYNNNIYNQIIPLSINPLTGYSRANINSGNVKHWGYELFIKAAPLVAKNFRWDVTFTAARQLSKVVELYPGINEQIIDGSAGYRVVGTIGKPAGDIQMFDYSRDPDGNRVVNANGLYTLGNNFKTFGNINPKAYGGLYSDFFLKGFNFHVGIDYKFGGKVFSYSNNYLVGNGVIKSTLANRDESQGGQAYYIENGTNKKIAWEHNKPAPANAVGGRVHHDGMILDGVKAVTTGGVTKYEKNDIIIAAPAYYQTYISDNSTGWPPDRLFTNDYIKLRELSVDYTIPRRISSMLHLQKLTITAAARNLFYLHKTLPNVDAESTLGAQGYVENSFYPSLRTFTFGVNVSF